jgi:hypothetical protein
VLLLVRLSVSMVNQRMLRMELLCARNGALISALRVLVIDGKDGGGGWYVLRK